MVGSLRSQRKNTEIIDQISEDRILEAANFNLPYRQSWQGKSGTGRNFAEKASKNRSK
jgi:hypothetical protein